MKCLLCQKERCKTVVLFWSRGLLQRFQSRHSGGDLKSSTSLWQVAEIIPLVYGHHEALEGYDGYFKMAGRLLKVNLMSREEI